MHTPISVLEVRNHRPYQTFSIFPGILILIATCPSLVVAQQSPSHVEAFSYHYQGPAEWSLDGSDPKSANSTQLLAAPEPTSMISVQSRSRPTRPLLPVVPAVSPEPAETTPADAEDGILANATCTNPSLSGKGTSYFERVSIAADGTVPVPAKPLDVEASSLEEEEKDGFFGLPDRTTLVSFRESTVDATRDTVQGLGSAVRNSRGMASELVAQMDIFRPRPHCEDCGKLRRRTPIRRFMAMIRGSESADIGTTE